MMECNLTLRETISTNLQGFDIRLSADSDAKAAAVALAICDLGPGSGVSGMPAFDEPQLDAALILTKRSSKLRRHAGQWALPGGRVDDGESVEQAAMREMSEEIGLQLDESSIIGRLDDFVTRSGFIMSPIVFWVGIRETFELNFDEVDSLHRIPINELMRDDAPILSASKHGDAPVLRMPIGDTWIAAPTAALLLQFREVAVLGKSTRVAHYDQPEFAWK